MLPVIRSPAIRRRPPLPLRSASDTHSWLPLSPHSSSLCLSPVPTSCWLLPLRLGSRCFFLPFCLPFHFPSVLLERHFHPRLRCFVLFVLSSPVSEFVFSPLNSLFVLVFGLQCGIFAPNTKTCLRNEKVKRLFPFLPLIYGKSHLSKIPINTY